MPIEIFNLPVDCELKGKQATSFEIPLTMAPHIVADNNKEYQVRLTFRGPKGTEFGEVITLRIKCVLEKQTDEVEIYKLAIKLH